MVDIADAQRQQQRRAEMVDARDGPEGRTIDGKVVLGGIWTPLNSDENILSDTNSLTTSR